MDSNQAPKSSRHDLKALIDHSASLKADFDKVHNALAANLSRTSFNNNNTTEITAGAQDSTLVAHFYGLYNSYRQLQAKLKAHAAHSRLDDAEEEATSGAAVFVHPRIIETKSFSSTLIMQLRHQASVNRLEGSNTGHLREAISVSLEAFFSHDWFRGSVRLFTIRILDSGNVEVVAHAEYREDLERLIQSTAWHEEFERSLGPWPTETFNVRMHNMRIGGMVFKDRKQKATVIKMLVDSNFPLDHGNSSAIRDISWCGEKPRLMLEKREKRTTALMIEFLRPEQANKALADGLFWQGTCHTCNIADVLRFGLQRCRLCQELGHLAKTCSGKPRCWRCAGPHSQDNCASTKMECVLCGGPHPSAGRGCKVWQQAKTNHGFPTTLLPPAAETQDAIKTEPDQPEPILDVTQSAHPTPETRLQSTDDFRILGMARNARLQPSASIRNKREAEDTLPKAVSDGGSKRRKREDLKQEDIKQEESPYCEDSTSLYRQASPYLVDRT